MSTSENKKTKKSCKILSQECIGTDIYSMWLDAVGKTSAKINKKHYPWNGKENMNEKADCSIDDRHNKKRYGWLLWK